MEFTKKAFRDLRERQTMFIESKFEHKKVTAEDVMIKPIFLYLEDNIETILEKLKSEEINYCMVVNEEKHFIGEISDEMLLKIIAHTSVNEPLVKLLDI